MSELGRPTKKTPEVVGKIFVAFNNGYSNQEACDYAGIHRDTLNDWINNDPEFSDKIEQAKRMPNRKSKENVIAAINDGDPKWSAWWLERKDPDFKNKASVDVNPYEAKYEEALEAMLNDPANQPDNLPDNSEETIS